MSLARFEMRLAARRGSLPAAAALFGALALGVTALGLASFRQLGLGAVSPAAAVLLNLAILFPSAYALAAGAVAMQGDRDGGLLAMLRAAGVGAPAIVTAKLCAVAASAGLVALAGFGAAAVVLAGNVAVADLGAYLLVLATALLAAATASSLGVLLGTLVRGRQQGAIAGLAVWFVLAFGVDLLAIVLVPAFRLGAAGVLVTALADPLEAARVLGLLALGADAQVLGPLGAYLRDTLGIPLSVVLLCAGEIAWALAAAALASRMVARRA